MAEDYKKYVSKDAFLKIQNSQTGMWITFDENFENTSFIKQNSASQVSLTQFGEFFLSKKKIFN